MGRPAPDAEGDELPAVGVDALDDSLGPAPGTRFDPVAGDIARDQKRQRRAESAASKIERAAKIGAKHRTADQVEYAAGNHDDGRNSVQQHEADRRPDAEAGNPRLQSFGRNDAIEGPIRGRNAGKDEQDDERQEPTSLMRHCPACDGDDERMETTNAGLAGARDRDRTCDPYHVKVVRFR